MALPYVQFLILEVLQKQRKSAISSQALADAAKLGGSILHFSNADHNAAVREQLEHLRSVGYIESFPAVGFWRITLNDILRLDKEYDDAGCNPVAVMVQPPKQANTAPPTLN